MENKRFCENVLSLIGQPYSQTDCIGVVRKAAGIRCQGTNWLWRSYNSRGKYQYLTQRLERPPRLNELKNGMLVFRIKWDQIPKGYNDRPNCHHVGVIVDGFVIQSNESAGVNCKPYIIDEWDGCGWLKFIDPPISAPQIQTPDNEIPISSLQIQKPDNGIPFDDIQPDELSDHEMIKAIYNHLIVD